MTNCSPTIPTDNLYENSTWRCHSREFVIWMTGGRRRRKAPSPSNNNPRNSIRIPALGPGKAGFKQECSIPSRAMQCRFWSAEWLCSKQINSHSLFSSLCETAPTFRVSACLRKLIAQLTCYLHMHHSSSGLANLLIENNNFVGRFIPWCVQLSVPTGLLQAGGGLK